MVTGRSGVSLHFLLKVSAHFCLVDGFVYPISSSGVKLSDKVKTEFVAIPEICVDGTDLFYEAC